ncbi:TPA: hypothetical protein VCV81_001409 [Streptococcus pyogenes]|nr:hypothetical protein [Streptococcus pyogenes]
MKTRPKRFLNLATLSLALLGTTLLMAQPVKADNDTRESQERVDQRIEDPYDDGKMLGERMVMNQGIIRESLKSLQLKLLNLRLILIAVIG